MYYDDHEIDIESVTYKIKTLAFMFDDNIRN